MNEMKRYEPKYCVGCVLTTTCDRHTEYVTCEIYDNNRDFQKVIAIRKEKNKLAKEVNMHFIKKGREFNKSVRKVLQN